jgi:hypothetical protein
MMKKRIKVHQKWNFMNVFEKFISLENKFRKFTKNKNLCVWKLNLKKNKCAIDKMFDPKISKCLQFLHYVNVCWLIPL